MDKGIRTAFLNNIETGKQTLAEIQEKGILLPYKMNGKDVYVKRIRVKAKPTSPIAIKQHKNVIEHNPKDYKQNYYVVNDENYLIALYRGKDEKGGKLSDYIVLNLLDAVHKKQDKQELYPSSIEKKGKILNLYKVLKIGKIVILKQTEDEDVFVLPKGKIWERMYRISGIASKPDGRINFSHILIQEAKNKKNEHELINEIEKYKRLSNSGLDLVKFSV